MTNWNPNRLSVRFEGSAVPGFHATGLQLGVMGAVRFDRILVAELGTGPAVLWLKNSQRSVTEFSWIFGGGLGFRVAESLAFLVRLGFSATSPGELVGRFIGCGAEWKI